MSRQPVFRIEASAAMKVLYANKYFFRKGGAETVMFDEINYMRHFNVEVIEFSMDNAKSPIAVFFVLCFETGLQLAVATNQDQVRRNLYTFSGSGQ